MTKWTNEELGKAIADAVFTTTIAKRETFNIAMRDMPINAILTLLAHGTQRKFNDAVGGADKSAETKVELARAMIEEYKEGKVAKRREGAAGVTDEIRVGRKLLRAMLPDLLPDAASLKTFRALDRSEQVAKLDEWLAEHETALAPMIEEELEKEREAAKRKDKVAAKIKVAL